MGLMRMLVFIGLGILIYTVFRRLFGPSRRPEAAEVDDERLGRLVQDPNCGVYVDSKQAVRRKVPDGELFFCSKDCATAYLEKSQPGS